VGWSSGVDSREAGCVPNAMTNSAEAPVSLNGVRAVARPVACRAPMATLEDAAIAVA